MMAVIGTAAVPGSPTSSGRISPNLETRWSCRRQQRQRHAAGGAQRLVPGQRFKREQRGPRSLAVVGEMRAATGEVPHQPASRRFPPPVRRARPGAPHAGDVVDQPGQLAGAEVRVVEQPRPLTHHLVESLGLPARDDRVGLLRHPHDRRMDRFAAAAVPDQAGLAMGGDTDRGDVVGGGARPWPSPLACWPAAPATAQPGRVRPSRASGSSERPGFRASATMMPSMSTRTARALVEPSSSAMT